NNEASNITEVIPWARVEVNLDKVSLPDEPMSPTISQGGRPRLVFISRVSRKKNLDLILRSLQGVSAPVEFDIYWPLEDAGYWSKCESLMHQIPPFVQVRYRGELAPSDVPRTFAQYDAFIFPTLGENFGHIIAESLSAS